jgi:hypothetical protein
VAVLNAGCLAGVFGSDWRVLTTTTLVRLGLVVVLLLFDVFLFSFLCGNGEGKVRVFVEMGGKLGF